MKKFIPPDELSFDDLPDSGSFPLMPDIDVVFGDPVDDTQEIDLTESSIAMDTRELQALNDEALDLDWMQLSMKQRMKVFLWLTLVLGISVAGLKCSDLLYTPQKQVSKISTAHTVKQKRSNNSNRPLIHGLGPPPEAYLK